MSVNAAVEGDPDALARPRPVFIGGCPRSGTTLLGAMLGTGPDRVAVPEAVFKFRLFGIVTRDGALDVGAACARLAGDEFFRRWGIELPVTDDHNASMSYAEFLEGLVRRFAALVGKPSTAFWIDHTPGNIRYAITLGALLADARFINVIRDGRGVAASAIPLDWGPNTVSQAAAWWSTHIALGLAATQYLGPGRITTVRYEDLVSHPEKTLQGVCRFLGTSYDAAMVSQRDYAATKYSMTEHGLVSDPPNPERSRAWEQSLSPRQVEAFEHLTGELLAALGYEMSYGIAARLNPRHQRLGEFCVDVARRAVLDKVRRRQNRRVVR